MCYVFVSKKYIYIQLFCSSKVVMDYDGSWIRSDEEIAGSFYLTIWV